MMTPVDLDLVGKPDDHRVIVEPACGAALAAVYRRAPALASAKSILVVTAASNVPLSTNPCSRGASACGI